ncbi:DUF4828 domain-containing protein [Lacticaseibacillus chiayiensis]|uniref:DUF4828 domain-containing protein n=1 Tax=Lacticaseibacillus chiayiensis TaxID=2100821 RepID=A0A4Q1UB09_9LACO|nr:DUF4828 domain-containing protein [Lacticaseibacillus chiayiensis]RXT27898.1 DUF4828 domain-containing protein [Lacticaseibacillus chiayiensis]RXT58139.1 DUF4828 domain-containing protein [Lacticaseibacillus chiayiensis]UYN57404.1 DUF4828 domain-containing protein [Lacticaseibacillus chiayiensis]
MASFLRGLKYALAHRGHHHKDKGKAPNPAMALAKNFTGNFAFLDEQTNKTHSLAISPQLQIAIDNKILPGQVVGITINELTFLDHYGYKLVITADDNGPQTIYDEAEDATYAIIIPRA